MAKNQQAAVSKNQQAPATAPAHVYGFDLKGRKDPKTVVEGVSKKSAAIRALSAANYTTAEIARLSDKEKLGDNAIAILQYPDGRPLRYQHARNVLTQKLKGEGDTTAA